MQCGGRHSEPEILILRFECLPHAVNMFIDTASATVLVELMHERVNKLRVTCKCGDVSVGKLLYCMYCLRG